MSGPNLASSLMLVIPTYKDGCYIWQLDGSINMGVISFDPPYRPFLDRHSREGYLGNFIWDQNGEYNKDCRMTVIIEPHDPRETMHRAQFEMTIYKGSRQYIRVCEGRDSKPYLKPFLFGEEKKRKSGLVDQGTRRIIQR